MSSITVIIFVGPQPARGYRARSILSINSYNPESTIEDIIAPAVAKFLEYKKQKNTCDNSPPRFASNYTLEPFIRDPYHNIFHGGELIRMNRSDKIKDIPAIHCNNDIEYYQKKYGNFVHHDHMRYIVLRAVNKKY